MQPFLRKALIALIAVSFAAAGGFAPKHAHAKGAGGHHAAGTHSHGAGSAHAHHHAVEPHDHAKAEAAADCHKDAAPAQQGDTPLASCCVASCSAIALIFAAAALPEIPQGKAFVLSLRHSRVLAARTSDDPPPR